MFVTETSASRETFFLTAETANKVLQKALSRGADFAEIFTEYTPQTKLTMEESSIRQMVEGIDAGAGVRVIKGDQVGYAFTETVNEAELLKAAEVAASIASGTAAVEPQNVTRTEHQSFFNVTDHAWSHGVDEKISLLNRANDTARSLDKRIVEVQCMYMDEVRNIQVINSEGLWVSDAQSLTRLIVFAVASDDNQRVSSYEAGGGRSNFGDYETLFRPEDIAEEAARTAIKLLTADDAPTGEMPVVIAPAYGGTMIHEAVGHGFEGDFISHNTSIYAGKVGQKVASDHVTIVDDGTMPFLRGSYNFDDEGNAAKRNVLCENGVLTGYLQDRISAKKLGMTVSGNGRRENFRYAPMPRMTNTFVDAGPHDPEEIIKSVKKGFYAMKMGSGQVDITSGNFVFTVDEAMLIEDGKLTRPLRGATLIGNGPDAMQKVDMVGSDLKVINAGTCGKGQWVPVGDGMPTIKVSSMTVGGKG